MIQADVSDVIDQVLHPSSDTFAKFDLPGETVLVNPAHVVSIRSVG